MFRKYSIPRMRITVDIIVSSHTTTMSGRGKLWDTEEVRCLIQIWGEQTIQEQLNKTHKNNSIIAPKKLTNYSYAQSSCILHAFSVCVCDDVRSLQTHLGSIQLIECETRPTLRGAPGTSALGFGPQQTNPVEKRPKTKNGQRLTERK